MREYIVSVDDDKKDFEEMFIGNVRYGDELVRCKDCIFREDKYCQLYIMEQHEVEDSDYCSAAERKEDA